VLSITLSRFRENLLAAKVSHATAATLAGIKPSTLSAALREISRIDSSKERDLLNLSFRLIELNEALEPLGLPTGVGALAALIKRLESGSLTPEQIRAVVTTLFE
jgi:hypothetical protein